MRLLADRVAVDDAGASCGVAGNTQHLTSLRQLGLSQASRLLLPSVCFQFNDAQFQQQIDEFVNRQLGEGR